MTRCYHFLMRGAGFVLAGGRSLRMGTDKALLPYGPGTLVQAVAKKVAAAVESVSLIGDPGKYSELGYPVYADLRPGCGPISGLHTALSLNIAEWNLVVGCDMPALTATLLSGLMQQAEMITERHLACVAATTDKGYEPLCAVYHSSCLPVVERELLEGRFKMKVLLSNLQCSGQTAWPSDTLANINTPEDWTELNRDRHR